MNLTVAGDYKGMSESAAAAIAKLLSKGEIESIVPATGNTPMGLYEQLASKYRAGVFRTDSLHVFQLDEYLGIAPDDRRSFYGWMKTSFLDPLEIAESKVTRFDTQNPSVEEACAMYDRAVQAHGGFGLAILGLGTNGHLGYNEPPSDDHSRTRSVQLTPQSRQGSALYWGAMESVPEFGITAGLSHVLAARNIVLLASGESKSKILREALEGPVGPQVPASYLQLQPNVSIFADEPAARFLSPALRGD